MAEEMNFGRGVNPGTPEKEQPGLHAFWSRLFAGWTGKMKVVDPEFDYAVRAKIAPFLGRGERLMEFYARTGLGKAQILAMDRAEIAAFIDRVAANQDSDPLVPKMFEEKKSQPSKFIVTLP